MRIKHDLGSLEAPRNLLLSKKATREVLERIPSEKRGRTVSPETKSHRFQHGWQHLQDTPENILNNNNNNTDDFGDLITINSNDIDKVDTNQNKNHNTSSDDDNNILDDESVFPSLQPSSPKIQQPKDDEGYENSRNDSDDSDDDNSSSDGEDTSISFSDTSPLLDVSSLDEDSSDSESDSDSSNSSNSSNDISDAEMSEDDGECLAEADDNLDNNNSCGEDTSSSGNPSSMDSPSWISFSEVNSPPPSEVMTPKKAPPSIGSATIMPTVHRSDGFNKRNGVVLPDVLPVAVPELDDDEAVRERRELEIQLKRRELKLDATPRISRDCCIVEITTQPDIHVDIRLNPTTLERPFPDPYLKQRNSYPREAAKNYNFYFKSRDIEPQCTTTKTMVQSAIGPPSNHHEKSSSRYFSMGEGVRLNNYTIVNGFNAVSLTEVVKSENQVVKEIDQVESDHSYSGIAPENSFIRNVRHRSSDSRGFSIDSHVSNRRYQRPKSEVLEQNPYADVVSCMNSLSMRSSELFGDNREQRNLQYKSSEHLQQQFKKQNAGVITPASRDACCQVQPSQLPYNKQRHDDGRSCGASAPKNCSPTKLSSNRKIPSPELFDVYTMESATSHINWSAAARNHRENEWLKKRQNDREEIRRKLAMDSDNEDHIVDKRSSSQDTTAVDRLKCGTNLQMCFFNEQKFKDDEGGDEGAKLDKADAVPQKPPLPRILKKNALFPPSLRKHSINSLKAMNNNNTTETVVKRQRPAFFFNRPRSWHAAKVEEKHYTHEDLFTCHQRLQEEAREALAQAKDMARMQMEIERQKKKKSPIADIVGISFPDGHNLLSRNALVEMNVAQLQVIVNDLHSQIETLNDDLVKFLLERDDLHMEQDSMLVDIEDLTRYLGLKGNASITQPPEPKFSNSSVSNSGDNSKKLKKAEPVRRSQSVHLKKSQNFVWPWHRRSVYNCTYSQG